MIADAAELGRYAVRIASEAAALVRARVDERSRDEHGFDVAAKSTSTDLVTDVDRATESFLLGRIAADRPADAVLGEEGGSRAGTSGVRWIVDPIDGTVNFVLGLPQYAVSVAAEVDGEVVAGAVVNAAAGEVYRAVRGGGAWLGERRLHDRRQVDLSRAVIGTGFAYDRERRRRQGEVAARLLVRVADLRRFGSAALDLCAVGAGRLDGYYEAGLNPWDYAAGALVAAEAGCVTGGLHDRPLDGRMAVAVAPHLASDLFALLEELGADQV